MASQPVVDPEVASLQSKPISRHPLSLPVFRDFWIARTLSVLGDQFFTVALPWIVLQLTSSALALGAVLMVAAIPRAVFMLVGGVATDRFSPRRVLMATAAIRTVLVGALAALFWLGGIQLWQLYVITFLFGITDAFSLPAAGALVPTIVDKEQLQAANSLNQSSLALVQMIGPAVAGLVIKSWGSGAAMLLDALSFLPLLAALFKIPEPELTNAAARSTKNNMLRSMQEGLRAVGSDRPLLWLLLLVAAITLSVNGPIGVGLPLMAKGRFGSPVALGAIITCFSLGALIGTIAAGVLKQLPRRGVLILIMSALTSLELVGLGIGSKLAIVGGLLLLMGLGAGFINVLFLAWLQARVDRAIRGRVMSIMTFGTIGLGPVSLVAAGILAQWSITGMFVVSGALLAVMAAVAATSKDCRQID